MDAETYANALKTLTLLAIGFASIYYLRKGTDTLSSGEKKYLYGIRVMFILLLIGAAGLAIGTMFLQPERADRVSNVAIAFFLLMPLGLIIGGYTTQHYSREAFTLNTKRQNKNKIDKHIVRDVYTEEYYFQGGRKMMFAGLLTLGVCLLALALGA